MNPWPNMTSAALLGSGRGGAPVALPAGLDELLGGTEAELRLLRAAGILEIADAAAREASVGVGDSMTPAPAEELPPVQQRDLSDVLERIIDDARPPLVIEACELVAKNRRCLPPRLLPRALELGRKASVLRAALHKVLGKRGAWLASQNADWKFGSLAGMETADRRIWDEGDATQRAAFLKQLRRTDADGARTLLEQSFASEAARDRAQLLPALGENLSGADESFLAAALATDRSKDVRQIAAALLSRLPASGFAQRMIARIESCVRTERKLLRQVVVIEPPAAFATDWKADGFDEKAPAALKLGERAWWLQQIVSFVPLNWWETRLNLSPAEVFGVAAKSEWKAALLGGFRAAITNQPRFSAWTLALLEHGGFPHEEAVPLALTLPPEQADAALRRILSSTNDPGLATHVIEAADFPWSADFWRVVKQKFPKWLAQQDWRFRSAISMLACRMPPEFVHDEIAWPDLPVYSEAIADFSRVVDMRRALHQIRIRNQP